MSFGTLARQVGKLARLWHVGTLAHKNEKLARFCHVDSWAPEHVDQSDTHDMPDTRFSKLLLM